MSSVKKEIWIRMRQNILFQFCRLKQSSLRFETSSNGGLVRASNVYPWSGLLHLMSVPPGCCSTFCSYPRRLNKIAFTPEDFHKILVYPCRIWVQPPSGGGGNSTVIKCNTPIAVADDVTKVEKVMPFSKLWGRV